MHKYCVSSVAMAASIAGVWNRPLWSFQFTESLIFNTKVGVVSVFSSCHQLCLVEISR